MTTEPTIKVFASQSMLNNKLSNDHNQRSIRSEVLDGSEFQKYLEQAIRSSQ